MNIELRVEYWCGCSCDGCGDVSSSGTVMTTIPESRSGISSIISRL